MRNNYTNPCVRTEQEFNESVNNEFKNNEEKQFITSNNESEQIMKLTQQLHVCLIKFLIHYFDIMNSVKSGKTHYILITSQNISVVFKRFPCVM